MPLQIVRNDITQMRVDAIVNAADSTLLGGGGVDGCIHRAAGPGLLAECRTLGGCETGDAKITGAGKLPCRYVIHAVGPRWIDGRHGEPALLASCYRTALALAEERRCETVAFPLLSSGAFGYPKDQALRTAVDTIGAFLLEHDMTVYLVIFDRSAYQISGKLFSGIAAYIDDHYVEAHTDSFSERLRRLLPVKPRMEEQAPPPIQSAPCAPPESLAEERTPPEAPQKNWTVRRRPAASMPAYSLEEALRQIDESFSEMLLRKIDGSGMTDAQFYKKANMDRKHFSKIRGNRSYRPSKPTAIASAIALELSLEETRELLMKAGFALSHSNKFDIIVEYFIRSGNYNIFEINEALFAFDQSLLGV